MGRLAHIMQCDMCCDGDSQVGCESTEVLIDFRWMGFCSHFAYISLMSGYLRGSIGNGYACKTNSYFSLFFPPSTPILWE